MTTILDRMAYSTYPTVLRFWDSVEYGSKDRLQEAARDRGDVKRANNIYRSVFNIGCKKLVLDNVFHYAFTNGSEEATRRHSCQLL